MAKNLKEQTISALFWSFMDKGGQQIFQFAFLVVFARLLSPVELGLIGALAIFTAVANMLQESGFSSALIRNQNIDEEDKSTVFYFNISVGIGCYVILFFTAPLIANFFEEPILTNLSRFLFLSFVFSAFGVVQNVHLVRNMDFRKSTQISVVSSILAGGIGVVMAYNGFGVWSLAAQQVLQALFRMVLLWFSVRWIPRAPFCSGRLKSMTGYSSKLLLNSLFNQIAANVSSIVIGKKFSMFDLGNYNQAFKFGNLPQGMIASSMQSVAFPLLSKLGDNLNSKRKAFRKIVRVVCFICFPITAFTIVAAEPIVMVVLEEKWVGVIPILQLLVIGSSVLPLFYLLSSLLQALGKSGLLLTLETARNIVTLLVIIYTVRFGVNGVVLGTSCIAVISFLVAYYIAGKCIGYTMWQVFKDIVPYGLIAMVAFFPMYGLSFVINNNLFLLTAQLILGGIIYLAILKIFGSKVVEDMIDIIRKKGTK
ncbi:lipopolysaccharide biosynthesis protein [Dysgonomonas macrotermitis]|uniref:Membrane protein involved in the export of O-antigen and teichoic acid n=1 Tax=Dysgonomonas macrotermitis TaxID=1346286 RepID=A0A1M5IFK7_9BACT|nr:lipopolysaccharide biosynthesis protein [Dysgonomonas macrotermitis]SHG27128.1 Membrane protein involved in the export of O-antigen and teichoic acid [Dysgonomonas macrotermitis]